MPSIGLIGYPLEHSFSPQYFAQKFESLQLNDWQYHLFPIASIHSLYDIIKGNSDLIGLNVTIPHKQSVIQYCQHIDEDALQIGAVNGLIIQRDNKDTFHLKGINTDWMGFYLSLKNALPFSPQRALICGNGGASLAVQYALNKLNIPFQIVSRNGTFTYQDLNEERFQSFQLIINTTPVGTLNNSERILPLPYQVINADMFFYDLVYNPEVTPTMELFMKHGAQAKNGLEMLHLQADLFWQSLNSK
jgi:shikimate dehydrogenase